MDGAGLGGNSYTSLLSAPKANTPIQATIDNATAAAKREMNLAVRNNCRLGSCISTCLSVRPVHSPPTCPAATIDRTKTPMSDAIRPAVKPAAPKGLRDAAVGRNSVVTSVKESF